MAVFGLIGGRSNPHIHNCDIERQLFQATQKEKPKVLYFPFASQEIESSCIKFEKLVQSLSIELDFMKTLGHPEEVRGKVQWADILYFGGGNCEELVFAVLHSCLYGILKEQLSTDKLFCGISAGAILWCVAGMGDRHAYANAYHIYNYRMVEGLGFLPVTICPHYDHDGLWCYNDEVQNYPVDAYALEDDTALFFKDGKVTVIKQDLSKSVYFFDHTRAYQMIPLYKEKEQ